LIKDQLLLKIWIDRELNIWKEFALVCDSEFVCWVLYDLITNGNYAKALGVKETFDDCLKLEISICEHFWKILGNILI
jgi:hypothetical protein